MPKQERVCMRTQLILIVMKVFALMVNRTAKTRDYMRKWDRVIQFQLNDRGALTPFYLEFSGGKASYHRGMNQKPDVLIETNTSTFPKLLRGEVDPQEAYLFKEYRFKGSIVDASKFNLLSKVLQESYPRLFGLARLLRIMK